MTHCLAVDLGGTNVRVALMAPDGTVLERRQERTRQDASCPGTLLNLAGDLLRHEAVSNAVIGVPAWLDYGQGRVEWAPNLPPAWVAELHEAVLADALGVPVALANDGDLAAVGEAYFGAGRKHRDVAYVTLSTGVGAGVLLNGRLVRGRRSLAELGHTTLDLGAAGAGLASTPEQLASGTALGRRAAEAGLSNRDAGAKEVLDAVRAGSPEAMGVWDEVVGAASAAVANLVTMFAPEVVVVGGGLGRNADLVLGPIRQALAPYLDRRPGAVAVITAELGDDAGLIGAPAWAAASPDRKVRRGAPRRRRRPA